MKPNMPVERISEVQLHMVFHFNLHPNFSELWNPLIIARFLISIRINVISTDFPLAEDSAVKLIRTRSIELLK